MKPIAFSLALVMGVLLGVAFLGESFGAQKGIGVLLMLAGIALLTTAPERHEEA